MRNIVNKIHNACLSPIIKAVTFLAFNRSHRDCELSGFYMDLVAILFIICIVLPYILCVVVPISVMLFPFWFIAETIAFIKYLKK